MQGIKLLDCGSHSCLFAENIHGQRTNGPCMCLTDVRPHDIRKRIQFTLLNSKRFWKPPKGEK